jgi:hypothetical protein
MKLADEILKKHQQLFTRFSITNGPLMPKMLQHKLKTHNAHFRLQIGRNQTN